MKINLNELSNSDVIFGDNQRILIEHNDNEGEKWVALFYATQEDFNYLLEFYNQYEDLEDYFEIFDSKHITKREFRLINSFSFSNYLEAINIREFDINNFKENVKDMEDFIEYFYKLNFGTR